MTARAHLPERPRCSSTSESYAEPLLATASHVHSWLLLEHAGAWPATALASPRLPPGLASELARRANAHGVRIVLLRRVGRHHHTDPPACFVARTTAEPWLGRVPLHRVEDVLDVDLAALVSDDRDAFEPVGEMIFCVCTHGRHDPCCAERGRPVAAALSARFPDAAWEVSHIGGDRFAGNVVCFPDGDYLGRLDATTAVPVLEAYADGRYVLDHLRGRAAHSPRVQAAELFVRRGLGIDARGAVRPRRVRDVDGGVAVTLDVAGRGMITCRLEVTRSPAPRPLTCHASHEASPPTYRLVSID